VIVSAAPRSTDTFIETGRDRSVSMIMSVAGFRVTQLVSSRMILVEPGTVRPVASRAARTHLAGPVLRLDVLGEDSTAISPAPTVTSRWGSAVSRPPYGNLCGRPKRTRKRAEARCACPARGTSSVDHWDGASSVTLPAQRSLCVRPVARCDSRLMKVGAPDSRVSALER